MLSKLLIIAACAPSVLGYTDRGILKLDNTTFDRIIDGVRGVFVRFDKEYAYGDANDAWKNYAKTVGDSSADLLSCDVGVSDYGDKDGADLAERFNVKTEDFPKYFLFQKGTTSTDKPLAYTGKSVEDEFLKFVQERSGSWIGMPGQIKEMDTLAKELQGGADVADIVKRAEAVAAKSDEDTGKYYVKVMSKYSEDKGFVEKETLRLKKMMDDGSVKPAKKTQFGRRLNVLTSFA